MLVSYFYFCSALFLGPPDRRLGKAGGFNGWMKHEFMTTAYHNEEDIPNYLENGTDLDPGEMGISDEEGEKGLLAHIIPKFIAQARGSLYSHARVCLRVLFCSDCLSVTWGPVPSGFNESEPAQSGVNCRRR